MIYAQQIMAPLQLEVRPGLCFVCESPLAQGRNGRPRKTCGSDDCLRVYHQLRRSRVRELVALGIQAELKAAAKLIRSANRKLERAT